MDGDDFTFAMVPPLAGGGIFLGGGRIGPPYPVFGRPRSPPRRRPPELGTATARVPLGRLMLVDREPSSAQPPDDDDHRNDDIDGSRAETYYCPWCPGSLAAVSPARCRKSGSTGSVLRWSQRLIGRSHSDGKEKFVFLNTSSSGHKERSGAEGGIGGHAWSYYAKGGGTGRGGGNGGRRRSFLPYKQDLVGLFANATAFRRSYHPF